MISELLKEKTAIAHQDLERVIIPSLKAINSKEDYAKVLKMFAGYTQPVEALIEQYVPLTILPDYIIRRKAADLAQDLETLGFNIEENISTKLPTITNEYQAMGALYVMEGSTLGGSIISKIITQKLGSEADGAIRFFNSYGEKTMDMWQQFKAALNTYPDDAANEIGAGAIDTFVHFRLWAIKCFKSEQQ